MGRVSTRRMLIVSKISRTGEVGLGKEGWKGLQSFSLYEENTKNYGEGKPKM